MTSTTLVIVPARPLQVPAVALDDAQQRIVELAGKGHLIFRGIPGAGKTTTLLSIVATLRDAGQRFAVLAPDRQRAAHLNEQVRVLVENVARPVNTPAGFAYGVIERWRNLRADPLGGVELVTGAQEDAQIGHILTESVPEELRAFVGDDGQASALLRMELRNLFSTAQRLQVSPDRLRELGELFDFPAWVGAAGVHEELENQPDRHVHYRGAMRVTHSQVEGIAAQLMATWDETAAVEQLTADNPLPDVVVVDDLQDMTPATVSMLAVMAQSGCRIIAASEPDVSVATFRGAIPLADVLLARLLGIEIVELESCHRGSGVLRSMVRRISAHVTNAGPAHRRQVEKLERSKGQVDECTEEEVGSTSEGLVGEGRHEAMTPRILVAQTNAQMGAQIARLLRENYLFQQIGWEQQVVIVRSQSQVRDIQRQLKRFSVPVDTATQAFHFMAEPSTRMMLRLLHGAALDSGEDTDALLSDLMSSSLIGVDPVDLRRLLRAYSVVLHEEGELQGGDSPSVSMLLERFAPAQDAHSSGGKTLKNEAASADVAAYRPLRRYQDTIAKLIDTAVIWESARKSVELRPRQALWEVWQAAGLAQQWQERAIGTGKDATWYDTQLDALVALFRVADIWEQRNPAGNAYQFVSDIISQDLPVDTLGQKAYRPAAVQVLTPAQAAGQEWDIVIIAGAQDGQWPNATLRHHMLHSDILAEIAIGAMIGSEEENWAQIADPRRRRHSVRDDEYRLFLSALSRARHSVCFAAVLNEDAAPSELIERAIGVHPDDRLHDGIPRDEEGRIRFEVQPAPSPLDQTGLIGDLRFWATASQETCEQDGMDPRAFEDLQNTAYEALGVLIREGIPGAHPTYWQTPGEITTDQPLLQGIKPRISPSAVEKIETCPLQWFAGYVGADSRPGGAATRGTFIHALAEDFQKDPSISVTDLYHQRWPEYSQDMDAIEKRTEKEKVEACVNGLQAYFDSLPLETLQGAKAEEYIRVEMENYTIRGMIDRLEPYGDKWKIVDFKTGTPKTEEQALEDPQLQTYQFALGEMGLEVEGAQLQYVGQGAKRGVPTHVAGQRLQPALTAEKYEQRRRQLDDDVKVMNSAVFEARRNPKCQFCSFRPICPAWGATEGAEE